MSNKATCPACGSHTSDVWAAIRDGTECPVCGLSVEAMVAFDVAVKRGADEQLVERSAIAEQRAESAERELRRLQSVLEKVARLASSREEMS